MRALLKRTRGISAGERERKDYLGDKKGLHISQKSTSSLILQKVDGLQYL